MFRLDRNGGSEERQKYDPERGSSSGGGGGSSRLPDLGRERARDQAQEPDDSKTTEEWENDKFPKG